MSEKVSEEIQESVRAKVKFFREQVQLICTKCPEATIVRVAPGKSEASCNHWYATCEHYPDLARALPVSEPYTITEAQYYLGKSYCPFNFPEKPQDTTIEVIDICYVPVSKKLVDEYVNHVVDRLRGLRRTLSAFEKERLLFRVHELEDLRRKLHSAVATDAGFDMWETSHEAVAFKYALEGYVEKRAKTFGVC